MALRTAPQIQFDPLSAAQALDSLLDDFKINDCDQPKAPQLRLRSVTDCEINIKYGLNQFDLDGPRTVGRIVVEYAILDKSYSKHILAKSPRQKKKKKTERN